MASKKSRKTQQKTDKDFNTSVYQILEEVLRASLQEEQLDSYYSNKTKEMLEITEACFSTIAKRFQKANQKEKEILLKLMKHLKGIEHIQFLQDFVRKEMFLPRTGHAIFELFTKSDAIIEEGLASRLLDLDNLTQRIKQAITGGKIDTVLIKDFTSRDMLEREGIIHQLIDESDVQCSAFIVKVLEFDEKKGWEAIGYVIQLNTIESFYILEAIYDQNNGKEIEKILKKKAHALKQKGIKIDFDVKKEKKTSVLKKVTLPDPRAFISRIDAEGYRLIFLIKPVTAYETKIFNIVTNDMKGLQKLEVTNAFRKETQLFIEKLLADTRAEFIETKPENAVFLVEEACRITEEQGSEVNATIEQMKKLFSDVIALRKQAYIYDVLDEEAVLQQQERASNVEELFDDSDIVFWFVLSDIAKEHWEKLSNAAYSPLVLSDIQKQERVQQLHVETAQQFFTEQRRRIFKRRLEELAFFHYSKGRKEEAEQALYAGCSLTSPDFLAEKNNFCMEMITRGFNFFESKYGTKDKSSYGGIKTPKDFSQFV